MEHLTLVQTTILGEPYCNVEMAQWSMHKEQRCKTELQHTTVVWYGGSYTNKHDKLIDTSIQVPCNAKILALCTDNPY